MKRIYISTGFITLGLIFWAVLGYLMDMPSFRIALPLCISGLIVFLVAGFLKNREERKKFEEFLKSKKEDPKVQEKLRNEKIDPGDKTGRAKVRAEYKGRKSGVNWMMANIHGAVATRKKKREFLSKNS